MYQELYEQGFRDGTREGRAGLRCDAGLAARTNAENMGLFREGEVDPGPFYAYVNGFMAGAYEAPRE